jgi:integral membrane sensor domain MASE1/HAMP domain-containing protein
MSAEDRTLLVRMLIVGGAYYLAARLGLQLAYENASITAVWAPTGIAVASIYIWGYRVAPAVFVAATLANLSTPAPEWTAPVIGAGNMAEGMIGAYLLRLLNFEAAMRHPAEVGKIAAVAVLAPIVSATIGVWAISEALEIPYTFKSWLLWWGGDATGLLLFGSLILVTSSSVARRETQIDWQPALVVAGLTAASALAVVIGGAVFLVVLFGALAAVALERGPLTAVWAAALASTILIVAASAGHGPFSEADPDTNLLRTQALVASVSLASLLVASLFGRFRMTVAVGLGVLLAMGALAAVLTSLANDTLADEAADGQRAQLESIAKTFNNGFDPAELNDPEALAVKLEYLENLNPGLDGAMITGPAQPGSGKKGLVVVASAQSTGTPDPMEKLAAGKDSPAGTPGFAFGWHPPGELLLYEDHNIGGYHYGYSRSALRDENALPVALLDLAFNFSAQDASLADAQSELIGAAGVVALVAVMLLLGFFGRALLQPLGRLREATRNLAGGKRETRLEWERDDEFGALASDFDEMAEELDARQSRVETLGRYREAQLAVARVLAEGSGTAESTVPDVLRALGENFGWDAGVYWTPEADGQLRCSAFWQRPGRHLDGLEALSREAPLASGQGLPGRVFANVEPSSIESLATQGSSARELSANDAGMKGAVALPVVRGGEIVGVLEFFSPQDGANGSDGGNGRLRVDGRAPTEARV